MGLVIVLSGFIGLAAAAPAAGSGSNGSGYAVVRFADPAVGEYAGTIAGYPATQPLPGHKLDLGSLTTVRYQSLLGIEHANYKAWLHANAPQVQVLREYTLSFNGIAVALNGASVNSLLHGPHAVDAQADWKYQPTMDFSVPLIGADDVWNRIVPGTSDTGSLYTGLYAALKDVKVGVIDAGILGDHPFLASCREDNPVQHMGLYFTGLPGGIAIVSDHGTHVAGTIGGCLMTDEPDLGGGQLMHFASSPDSLGYLSGVAPGVSLYDYNVFPGMGVGYYQQGGVAFSHDIMAAVEDAVHDGMDVISLSLGGSVQGPHDLLAEAINGAVDAGTVAVVAAGNAGPGYMTVESPGTAANAITVGASSNAHFAAVPVSPDGKGPYAGIPGDFGPVDETITADYAWADPITACSALQNDLSGDIAVVKRGTCSFSTKIRNAQDAGAVAVVMVNIALGDAIIMGQDGTPTQPTLPAVMVSLVDGANFASAGGTATIDGTVINEFASAYGDVISSFSGRGPTPYNFLLKPDLTAPGQNVLSSVFSLSTASGTPVYTPYYAFFQGTSMATPHVTGSVALLLAQHPDWSPVEIKSALVNTAQRPVWTSAAKTRDTDALARGSGRVDVLAATAAPVALYPSSLSFGITMGNAPVVGSIPLTLTSLGGATSCSLSVAGDAESAFTLSPATVPLTAGGTATVTVSLNAGQGLAPNFYLGDVVVTCTAGIVSTTLNAPYLFVAGGSAGWLQGNMNSRNPFSLGPTPEEFAVPEGYVGGQWEE